MIKSYYSKWQNSFFEVVFYMFFHFFDGHSFFFWKSLKLNTDSSKIILKSLLLGSKFWSGGSIMMKKTPHRFQPKVLAILANSFGIGPKSKSCNKFCQHINDIKNTWITIDYYSASNFLDLPPSQKRQQQPI